MKKRIFKGFMALLIMVALIFMPLNGISFHQVAVHAAVIEDNHVVSTEENEKIMIDVSDCQGVMDWDSVAPHIDYACLRLGYGSDLNYQDDKQFERNVAECERLGIKYGVYLYSYAISYDDIKSEINHVKRQAAKCNPVLGVYWDVEDADGYKSRNNFSVTSILGRTMLSNFGSEFVSAMRDAGYQTGIYANYNYFKNVLHADVIEGTKGFQRWLAYWGIDEPPMKCKIWQFGALEINGYEYDGDIYYEDYESEVTPATKINYSKIYQEQVSNDVEFTYQVQIDNDRWLPTVVNDNDYAGIYGHNITGLAISVNKGYAEYRVHTTDGRWLSTINSDQTNIMDYYQGYAGNGQVIDLVEVYYHTPDDIAGSTGYKVATYRVKAQGHNNYYDWQHDDQTTNGQDGFAGSHSNSIDAFQIIPNAA